MDSVYKAYEALTVIKVIGAAPYQGSICPLLNSAWILDVFPLSYIDIGISPEGSEGSISRTSLFICY